MTAQAELGLDSATQAHTAAEPKSEADLLAIINC